MNTARTGILRTVLTVLLAIETSVIGFSSTTRTSEQSAGGSTMVSDAVTVDYNSDKWQIKDQNARIEEYLGRKSLYLRSGFAFLKDVAFENGVIEVDMAAPTQRSFIG